MTSEAETSESYPFEGMPLRSGIFAAVARELFSGQLVQRSEVVNAVTEHHLGNGGLPGVQAVIPIAKKALTAMSKAGQVTKVDGAYGMWRFAANYTDLTIPEVHDDEVAGIEDDDNDNGNGAIAQPHCIYVYDYPAYAELAALRGDARWPHKIGFTRLTAEARVADQVGTALPESPRIVMAYPCPDALLLERALHAALELRGQKIADAPGTEWFSTNPGEIQSLIDFLKTPTTERLSGDAST